MRRGSRAPLSPAAMDTFEKVAVLDNEVVAQRITGVLTERGIPHILRSYHDSAYDGLFQGMRGWGSVEAPTEWHAEIQAVIADITGDG